MYVCDAMPNGYTLLIRIEHSQRQCIATLLYIANSNNTLPKCEYALFFGYPPRKIIIIIDSLISLCICYISIASVAHFDSSI